MPPFSQLTGFDFAGAMQHCDAVSPKLFTMHWLLMGQLWGNWLLQNKNLEEGRVAKALASHLGLAAESAANLSLADFAYPDPDQPHAISNASQSRKIQQAIDAAPRGTKIEPLVHGYGPLDDFHQRLKVAVDAPVSGVWINRYGYLSDEKLDVVAEVWNGTS